MGCDGGEGIGVEMGGRGKPSQGKGLSLPGLKRLQWSSERQGASGEIPVGPSEVGLSGEGEAEGEAEVVDCQDMASLSQKKNS